MKLSAAQFELAAAAGLKPYSHRLDGFAAACYDRNTADELISALSSEPDVGDMGVWGLTPEAWREGVVAALETAMDESMSHG